MSGYVWNGKKWIPFRSYEHGPDGNLVFDLGKQRSVSFPENVTIREVSPPGQKEEQHG